MEISIWKLSHKFSKDLSFYEVMFYEKIPIYEFIPHSSAAG